MPPIGNLLYRQLFVHPVLPSDTSFKNQTVIVTGANTGLGLAAAKLLVTHGAARVIIGVRTLSKGNAAKDLIERETGKSGIVDVWEIDLGNYESVITFAERVKTLDRVDAIIENAGVWMKERKDLEGHEATVTVNVISTFLLALLVLPKLQDSAQRHGIKPRLAIVTSMLSMFATLKAKSAPSIFEALDDQKTKDLDMRYNDTKLLEVMYGRKLAAALDNAGGNNVVVTLVHPGYCKSELHRDMRFVEKVSEKLLARTTEEGGFALVDGVVDSKEGRHGQYLADLEITKPAVMLFEDEGKQATERVFKELNEILERIVPGITGILR